MPVTQNEWEGYPQERFTRRAFEATRRLKCAWTDRYTLLGELIGVAYPYASGSNAIPVAATIEPMGWITSSATYQHAIITVQYSNEVRKIDSKFISEEFLPAKEIIELDYRDFEWSGGGALTAMQRPRLIIPIIDIRTTFYDIAAAPTTALSLMGGVNNAPATSFTTGITFATGRLLYDSFEYGRNVSLAQADTFKIEYLFHARPVDWNYFFNPNKAGGAGFDSMKILSTGATYIPHAYVNLSSLVP